MVAFCFWQLARIFDPLSDSAVKTLGDTFHTLDTCQEFFKYMAVGQTGIPKHF